jgi:hypothetical protein
MMLKWINDCLRFQEACQNFWKVQSKPIQVDEIRSVRQNHADLERRVNKLEYEIYGIYVGKGEE